MNKLEEARNLLLEDLRNYLVGPHEGDDELIPERASDRYHVGILWPSGSEIAPEEDDVQDNADVGGGDPGNGDGVFALANASQQAAMGFAFQVPDNVPFSVEATWAEYVSQEAEKGAEQETTVESSFSSAENPAQANSPLTDVLEETVKPSSLIGRRRRKSFSWKRCPTSSGDVVVQPAPEENNSLRTLWSAAGVELSMLERRVRGLRIITISLVNRRNRPVRGKSGEGSDPPVDPNIYQAKIRVLSENGQAIFLARPSGQFISDPEFLIHELLYRNVRQFSVGHGCAVDWAVSSPNSEKASAIWSEWIPATESFKASSEVAALAEHRALKLPYLCEATRDHVIEALREFPTAYGQWIEGLDARLSGVCHEFEPGLRERIEAAAKDNLDKCRTIQNRILEGIELLADDQNVWDSFVLANRAMEKSMIISRPGDTPRWHPFQLAFLLLAIPSTAYGDHHARDVLDLIWFPTGGGKTEAYLGLVAFTLFFRRLGGAKTDEGFGTAVITRYTLRLLTMQQFERAARAVMACEVVRREDEERFGGEGFSIGLFVGNNATPGTLNDAAEVLLGTSDQKSLTTLPVAECPWCRTPLSIRDQKVELSGVRLATRCPNQQCEFHAGIPIACVDDELYAHPPSMIIGTVDKFAMMAWRPEIGELFGGRGRAKPPTLIIQDELHLIGDALGSMTGLYETAFDILCSDNGVKPKVVGSTATIRRAEQQVHAVFLRRVAQFPPSGLDQDDAFFYREERGIPGRLYVGVHAQGRSTKHTLARLMGILGQGVSSIEDIKARDSFWTLVAYFNSLRELGGAWVLGLDDVPKYVKAMPRGKGAPYRPLAQITELTSHLPSTDIPIVLKNLSVGIDSSDLNSEPIDLLLCTNMISVGVDIDRLGLMVINGQPKTTAEYIQASSRVGRPKGAAGLVVVLYNWTRPRDRSHYERFRTYHESFYRNVEATSVTPFSARARDKALHAVLVALLRLKINRLALSPVSIESSEIGSAVSNLIEEIVVRARSVSNSDEVALETREDLERIISDIQSVARVNGVWSKSRQGKQAAARFMRRPNESEGLSGGYETPQSMRDVDPPCSIELKSISQIRGATWHER